MVVVVVVVVVVGVVVGGGVGADQAWPPRGVSANYFRFRGAAVGGRADGADGRGGRTDGRVGGRLQVGGWGDKWAPLLCK